MFKCGIWNEERIVTDTLFFISLSTFHIIESKNFTQGLKFDRKMVIIEDEFCFLNDIYIPFCARLLFWGNVTDFVLCKYPKVKV